MDKIGVVIGVITAMLAFGSLAVAASSVEATVYSFATIDPPGAVETIAFGINPARQIVGTFHTTQSTGPRQHGFLYSGGSFTTIDAPGASRFTEAHGINSAGQIVGFAATGTQVMSFLYSGGNFASIEVSSAFSTFAHGINTAGQIAGYYFYFGRPGGSSDHGFVKTGDSFSFIDAPGVFTNLYGINDAGQLVGTSLIAGPSYAFVYTDGSFDTIQVPGVLADFGRESLGINNMGHVVGTLIDETGTHGFLEIDGSFTFIDVPGATKTFARGINDEGQIVGSFLDGTGTHAFLATPAVPEPSSLALLVFGIIGLGLLPRRISLKPVKWS